MLRYFTLFALLLLISSCGVKRTYSKTRPLEKPTEQVVEKTDTSIEEVETATEIQVVKPQKTDRKAGKIIKTAMQYEGVRYRYGGTTKKGMDCSGLVYVSMTEHGVSIPRVSYKIAEASTPIKVKNVQKGDLLFFRTSKKRNRINHVGLVIEANKKHIKFIHSTSSRGVIVSSLKENYWNNAFVKATRVL